MKAGLVDHWAEGAREVFIERLGHPHDACWQQGSAACTAVLMADPHAWVPPVHHLEVTRTLRHQPRQARLGLDGSSFTAQRAREP